MNSPTQTVSTFTKSALQNSVARLAASTLIDQEAKAGTAFPISARHLVTCRHCVPPDCTLLTVTFPQIKEDQSVIECAVIWTDAENDLAILMVAAGAQLPTAVTPFIFGEPPREGDKWWSFGFPKGLPDGDEFNGVILRPNHVKGSREFIRISCEQGDDRLGGISGAPVVIAGRVVGVIAESVGGGKKRVDAVSFDGMRKHLAELADAAQVHGALCRWSRTTSLPFKYEVLKTHRAGDQSTLFCLLVEVKNDRMEVVKSKLKQLDKAMALRQNPLQDNEQVVAWSLLGSKELLLQIRAQKLKVRAVLEAIYEDCGNDVNIEEVDVFHEFVPVGVRAEPGIYRLVPAIVKSNHIPDDVNSHRFKAFIHLMLGNAQNLNSNGREKYLRDVLATTSTFGSIVDLVACNDTRQTIIIELTLPCGRIQDLFALTGRMEHGFHFDSFNKSTYLSYDVTAIWPNDQTRDSESADSLPDVQE